MTAALPAWSTGAPSPADALEAILAFVAREQDALSRRHTERCGLALEARLEAGYTLGPLTMVERDGPDLVLWVEADDSAFREGDAGLLGPAAVGETELSRGLPVRYVRYDQHARLLTLSPDRGAGGRAPAPGTAPLYLDARKVDLTDLLANAARTALGSPQVSPLVQAMLLGGASTLDGPRAEILEPLGRARGLNRSQARAFASQAASPLALVQGPPGTGKTHVLGAVVGALAAAGQRVLVCTLAHRAVNNALNTCAEHLPTGTPLAKLGDADQAYGLDHRVQQLERQADVGRLPRGGLVLGTTMYRVPRMVERGHTFDVVIFDEAGQLTVPEVLCGAIAAPRALFFGDHRQLPPIVNAAHPDDGWRLDRSAFELLAERHPPVMLTITYRLNAELAAFPSSAFYHGRLRPARASAGRRLDATFAPDHPLSPLLDPDAPLALGLVSHQFLRVPSPAEVEVVGECVRLALGAGLRAEQIAVLSPYRGQNRAIRARLHALAAEGLEGANEIVVDTVDRMQGQQRDLVVVSLALSDPVALEHQADFFYLPNRLNVAITRARTKCVVLGSPTLLTARSPAEAMLRGTTTMQRLARSARQVAVDVGRGAALATRILSEPATLT